MLDVEPSSTEPSEARPTCDFDGRWLLLAGLCAVSAVIFILYTQQVWEDFLITFRHSRNWVEGHGLVYQPGRRVHGYTSVINTLLPAIFDWLAGGGSYLPALNLYRATCVVALVAGAAVLMREMLRQKTAGLWPAVVVVLLLATDAKTIWFTSNGQETAYMVLFLSLGLIAAHQGLDRAWKLAAAAATGLLYTRPDAPIYIAVLALAGFVHAPEGACKRQMARGVAKAAAVASIAYLPWLLWVWSYYGSPVPNTILAKSSISPLDKSNPFGLLKAVLMKFPQVAVEVFEPTYARAGGWPRQWLDAHGLICTALAGAYCLVPVKERLGRMASLCFVLLAMYMSLVDASHYAFPWYLPCTAVFAWVAIAQGTPATIGWTLPVLSRHCVALGRCVHAMIIVSAATMLVLSTEQARWQQRIVEDSVRKPLGLWLRNEVKPGERVFLEPIGYIGYYSNADILDFPGLVAPEVVAVNREGNRSALHAIHVLKPTWLVLRPNEARNAMSLPAIHEAYEPVKVFEAQAKVAALRNLAGKGWIEYDHYYVIFKRMK